jgi:hypothetical protein
MGIEQDIGVDEVFIRHDLSFVKFVAGTWRRPSQVKPLAQPGQGALSSSLISLAFAHDLFKTRGEEGADGSTLFGCQHADFAQESRVQFQCNIGLHLLARKYVQHYITCSRLPSQI